MHTSTAIKVKLNQILEKVNLHLDTLTLEKIERRRLARLEQRKYFDEPPFPTPKAFLNTETDRILAQLPKYAARFDDFEDRTQNEVGYSYESIFYTSPDAEVLYTLLQLYRPPTVIEVGSGDSTKIMRQAIIDGQLPTRLISIDPYPRTEIDHLSDERHRERVEDVGPATLLGSLRAGDLLFIDSSHDVKTGSDVVYLFLEVIPKLPAGVLIHIHDIFLPYDYPVDWVIKKRWGYNEQYLVQAMLMFGNMFEVLWAGHFLQRTRPDFAQYFPHWKGTVAASLWLRKSC